MNAWEAKRIAQAPIWRERVIACRGSGLSVRDWCEQEGVGLRSYYRHEREFLDLISAEQRGPSDPFWTADRPVFAELPAPKQEPVTRQTGQAAATVHIGTVAVDIYDGAAEETLRTLLRVLRHAE